MVNKYSTSEFIKNVYSLIMTKLTMKQARFIRRPIYIRGRKSLCGGENLTTGRFCRFDLDGKEKTLYIGKNCEMGDMTHIVALNKVEIGNDVLIASKCFISDTSHGCYVGENQDSPDSIPSKRKLISGITKIGDKVWIGENSIILEGANIGNGCIIGANTLVSKRIPDGAIVVGNNKIIKLWNNKTRKWEKID